MVFAQTCVAVCKPPRLTMVERNTFKLHSTANVSILSVITSTQGQCRLTIIIVALTEDEKECKICRTDCPIKSASSVNKTT